MKITFNFLIVFVLALLTSCSTSDEAIQDVDDNNTPQPISSSYWPYAVGNKWLLKNEANPNETYSYHIHKKFTFDNNMYFQFEPINAIEGFDLKDGFREDDGIFISLIGETSQMGINTSAGTITYINTKLNVGEVWNEEVTLIVSGAASGQIKHTHQGKILDRLNSVTINGKNYNDVIKTELKKTIFNSLTGNSFTIIYENWLARGVGIIYEKNTYNATDIEQFTLISYDLN